MNHVDLFSGIGGFALAARNVWGGAYRNVCFCEINKYCQAVLRKNFGKDIVIYDDIRDLTSYTSSDRWKRKGSDGETQKGLQKRSEPSRKLSEGLEGRDCIDLLTGGFPCQPFSQAGKRKGTSDDRYLWPEMLRVIHEFKPTWVVAENVRGLLTIDGGVVFENCCADLEREGYEVQPFVIPACAVGAPHRRDRVWIVANRTSEQDNGERGDSRRERRGVERKEQTSQQDDGQTNNDCAGGQNSNASDPQEQRSERDRDTRRGWTGLPDGSWDQNWLEVATRFCGVDDGLPGEMDGATLSKAGNRVERLKALGNAIVPQVAEQIMKSIKEIEQC